MSTQPRVLFVCEGNTCRSPMAAGAANALYNETLQAESAGRTVHGEDPANATAVSVAKERLGLDLSNHATRAVEDVAIKAVDLIVAMEPRIAGYLRQHYEIPSERLVVWDVPDPYGQGRQVYRETLEGIQERLEPLSGSLAAAAASPRTIRDRLGDSQSGQTRLERQVTRLTSAIERWRNDLRDPEPRGTTLEGAWKKAIGSLEALLREALRVYLDFAGWSYEEVRKRHGVNQKSIEGMGLGSIIYAFRKIDSSLTEIIRSRADPLPSRSLFGPIRPVLEDLNQRRRPFIHQRGEYTEYSEDEKALREQLAPVLDRVEEVLDDELVSLALSLQADQLEGVKS